MVSEIAEESGGESDDEVPEETKMVDDPSCLIENESESFAYTRTGNFMEAVLIDENPKLRE